MEKSLLVLLFLITFWVEGSAQPRNKDNSADIHFAIPLKIHRSEESPSKPADRGSKEIYYDHAILKLPESYIKSGKPTRLIYCAHGAGGGVTSDKWFLNNYALVDTLLANGYAIFDVNGGELVENMGGPLVVNSAFLAYLYIRKHYNIEKKIFVVGLSMGGLSSANFIYRYPNLVLAQGLFSAVLDLHEQAWEHSWLPSTRKAIATAFNFNDKSGNTWEERKAADWNPMLKNVTIKGKDTLKSYPVPVKIWHGKGDQIVHENFSRSFQKYILNSHGSCELLELDSDDHGLSCGNPMINHELMLFFRKFK